MYGIPAGLVQFALDSELRPSVMQMAVEDLGSYGPRFHRNESSGRFWFAAGNDVVNARISYSPPTLCDAVIYRRSSAGDLVSIITARRAVPGEERGIWKLREGGHWQIGAGETAPRNDAGVASVRLHANPNNFDYESGNFELKLDPLWLNYYDVDPKYIEHSGLSSLASSGTDFYSNAPYGTEMQVRYAHAFFPLLLSALASSLALLLVPSAVRLIAVAGIALAGYLLGSILVKIFTVLGTNGDVSPFVAGWFPVGALLALVATVVALDYGWRLRGASPAFELAVIPAWRGLRR